MTQIKRPLHEYRVILRRDERKTVIVEAENLQDALLKGDQIHPDFTAIGAEKVE